MRRTRAGEAGQAAVELALVLPVLLLIMVGILEFARAWNLHQAMTDAVREGTRRAVLADAPCPSSTTSGAAIDSVKAPIWRYLENSGYRAVYATTAITSPAAKFKCTGENVTVELTVPYKIFVLSNKTFNMRSSFTMRNE